MPSYSSIFVGDRSYFSFFSVSALSFLSNTLFLVTTNSFLHCLARNLVGMNLDPVHSDTYYFLFMWLKVFHEVWIILPKIYILEAYAVMFFDIHDHTRKLGFFHFRHLLWLKILKYHNSRDFGSLLGMAVFPAVRWNLVQTHILKCIILKYTKLLDQSIFRHFMGK